MQVSSRTLERLRDFAKRDGCSVVDALDLLVRRALLDAELPLTTKCTVTYDGARGGHVVSFRAPGFGPPAKELVDAIDGALAELVQKEKR